MRGGDCRLPLPLSSSRRLPAWRRPGPRSPRASRAGPIGGGKRGAPPPPRRGSAQGRARRERKFGAGRWGLSRARGGRGAARRGRAWALLGRGFRLPRTRSVRFHSLAEGGWEGRSRVPENLVPSLLLFVIAKREGDGREGEAPLPVLELSVTAKVVRRGRSGALRGAGSAGRAGFGF